MVDGVHLRNILYDPSPVVYNRKCFCAAILEPDGVAAQLAVD